MALASVGLVGSTSGADPAVARAHADLGGGAFPRPIAIAATWDPAVARTLGAAVAREAGARGVGFVVVPFGVARDPRMGRVEGTFGEDPHLVAELGVAALAGVDGDLRPGGVVGVAGRFAGPLPPSDGTDVAPAPIAERELREVYLPPFEAAVKRGPARAIVLARNEIDGVPTHANAWLVKEVLRGEWAYRGAVLADAGGVADLHETYRVAATGDAATALARAAGLDDALGPAREVPASRDPKLAAAALAAAERAIVLLENRGALPLELPAAGRPGLKIAVADLAGIGLREALRTRARGRADVLVVNGSRPADLAAAQRADRVVVVAGDDLAAAQALLDALAGVKAVVVLAGAQPAATPAIAERAGALVGAWSLGAQGANAVARALLGEANPGGKLPVTLARSPGHWPITYDDKPSARRGYLFDTTEPLYPFGWGLGYSTFEVGAPRLAKASIAATDSVEVSVDVRNTGSRAGDETVQVYVRHKVASVTRPVKALKAFRRVTLGPGESRTVTFTLEPAAFSMWDGEMRRVVEPGELEVLAGPDSSRLAPATLTITAGGA